MGHSVGEYVAACVAGIFSLEDGLKLITRRAALMQALPQAGEMVAVLASETQVRDVMERLPDLPAAKIGIAAVNGLENVVVSGDENSIKRLCENLSLQGVKTIPLKVSHAFHSPLMDPMLDENNDVEKLSLPNGPSQGYFSK